MGTVVNDKFQAQNGFESPNFTVDTTGKISANTIDIQTILLNGSVFTQYVPPEDDDSDPDEPTITNSFTTLAVTGGTFRVSKDGSPTLRVVDGNVRIDSIGVGTMDNVDIGQTTAGQVTTYALNMTNAPDSTSSAINLNGAVVNDDLNITDQIVLSNNPTLSTHATRKGYVDATATALAVAFGA